MNRISWKGHAAMFGANAIWGLMSPVAKMVMMEGHITPIALTMWRVAGAMILFWTVSLFQKNEKVGARDLLKLVVASLLAIVFNQGCFIMGVQLTSPANASIITTSMPLWAMVLAAIFLKEPITGKKVGGLACGALGALILIQNSRNAAGTMSTGTRAVVGDLLVMAAQVSYAFYFVLFKNFVTRFSLITTMKWMFSFAFLFLIPFTLHDVVHTPWSSLSPAEIGGAAYVVVGGTFVSYMLVVIGQRLLRPTVASMYNYVQPIVAGMVAILYGMEHFTLTKVFSIVLIFAGVSIVSASKSRKDMERKAKVSR